MHRRDFARLATLSLCASCLPVWGQSLTPQRRKFGYAVIGLGNIAHSFLKEIASSDTVQCVAFVTGHPETKGKEWAAEFGLPQIPIFPYDQMDQMKHHPEIDAVYVATPNQLHLEHTVQSAKAGKHVLCEKPMAVSSADCRVMIDACKKAQVELMVAYRMQYEPVFLKTKQLLVSGSMGRIVMMEGAFGFPAKLGAWRLNKKLAGGGPIFDVGIYPLNAMRFLSGEEPVVFAAQKDTMDTLSGRFRDVEESMAWTMRFPSGALASCTTSYGASIPGSLRLHCEKGTLEFVQPFSNGGNQLVGKSDIAGAVHEENTSLQRDYQLRFEAEAFAESVQRNKSPRASGEEGLHDLLAIEAVYRACKT